jgi:transposase
MPRHDLPAPVPILVCINRDREKLVSSSRRIIHSPIILPSVVETAKANGLERYQYLRQVLTVLPQAETVEAIESLLPRAVKKIPAETR